jgi:RNA polymerase sigma factor (sigma-70 family)
VATEADLVAVAGPVRRAVEARLVGARETWPELDPDDVVQETLARVWSARWRLERATLVPYGLVVARNLITSAERKRDLRQRHDHRLADAGPAEDPALEILAAEERAALATAMAALRADDKRLLIEHEVHGIRAVDIAARHGVPAGTVAARLARARARLRVQHLLVLRRVTLPTARCRGVLEALSLGDRRRQHALLAAEHLLGCRTCADLAEPLLTRRRSLTGLAPVAALVALTSPLWAWIRANPVPAAASGVGAVAVAVAVVVSQPSAPAPPAAAPSPSAPQPTQPATLTVDGTRLLPATRVTSVAAFVGHTAVARDVPVQAVPADEGFWVGTGPGQRVWVQLDTRGRESAIRIRPGQRASFSAKVLRSEADTAGRLGITEAEGAFELTAAGGYLLANPTAVVLH